MKSHLSWVNFNGSLLCSEQTDDCWNTIRQALYRQSLQASYFVRVWSIIIIGLLLPSAHKINLFAYFRSGISFSLNFESNPGVSIETKLYKTVQTAPLLMQLLFNSNG